MITPEKKAEVKSVPIKDLASRLDLYFSTAVGRTTATNCFSSKHENGDEHPSLVMLEDVNRFKCMSCGESGDVIDFVKGYKNCGFIEACEFIIPGSNQKSAGFSSSKAEKPKFVPVNADDYWQSRGISEEMKKKFNLELHKNGLVIPLTSGRIKTRNFSHEPKFVFDTNSAVDPGIYKTDEAGSFVFLTAGELDAIKLYQETSLPCWTGTTGEGSFQEKWSKDFEGIEKIYIIPDSDEPGRAGAEKTAGILGRERCFDVVLPRGKDVTEFFVNEKGTSIEFLALLDSATSFDDDSSLDKPIDYGSLPDEDILATKSTKERLQLGISKIDTGDFKMDFFPGFYLIPAAQGVGKSWLDTYFPKQFYKYNQKKSTVFSLEMTEPQLRERALQSYSNLTEKQVESGASKEKGIRLLKEIGIEIIELGKTDSSQLTPEILEKHVRRQYKKGHRVFFLDHAHHIPGMSDKYTGEKVADAWGRKISELCREFGDIWFFLFAQPTKEAAKSGIIRKEGIRYATRLVDTCDVFISLNRKLIDDASAWDGVSVDKSDSSVLFFLDKNRLSSLQAGTGWKLYLSKTGNFTELENSDVQSDEVVFKMRSNTNELKVNLTTETQIDQEEVDPFDEAESSFIVPIKT